MKRIFADDDMHMVCPHCYSDDLEVEAKRCPHCGQQVRRTARSWLGIFGGLILAVIIGMWIAAILTGNVQ